MGYGNAHELARLTLLANLRDGDPCARCGWPMRLTDQLDAEHTTPRALGNHGLPDALSHASCNRQHGARLGLALRGLAPSVERRPAAASRGEPVVTSREW